MKTRIQELIQAIEKSNEIIDEISIVNADYYLKKIDNTMKFTLAVMNSDFEIMESIRESGESEDINIADFKHIDSYVDLKELRKAFGAIVSDSGEVAEEALTAIKSGKRISEDARMKNKKYYEELQFAKEKIAEVAAQNELKRKETLDEIESLLAQGVDPNEPEICFLKSAREEIPVTVYPLHKAKDDKAVSLLLEYGANPTLEGYGFDSSVNNNYISNWNHVSSIEAACMDYDLKKVKAFLSAAPCLINIDLVDKCLLAVGINIEVLNSRRHLRQLDLIKELSKRASTRLLAEQLEFQLSNQECKFDNPSSQYYGYYCAKDKINIYSDCLNQKLSLPIWLVLTVGNFEQGNTLSVLPRELINLIVSMLFYTDMYEQAITEMNALRLKAFRETHLMLVENNYRDNTDFSNYLNSMQYLKSYNARIREEADKEFRDVAVDDDLEDLIVTKAWKLANKYYNNFFFQNSDFIEIVANKSKVNAFKIIQTVMTEYYQGFTNIIGAVNSPQQYIYRIEDILAKNQDQLTIKAWELALAHHENLSSENTVLVDELTQWITENGSSLLTSVYKTTMFESVKEMLTKYITTRLSELIDQKAENKVNNKLAI